MEPVERPEMWTIEDIVKAVHDGHTFLVLFDYKKGLFQPNGYFIGGVQYSATGVTVGPNHSPDIQVTPEGTLQLTLYFQRGMVPEKDFYRPPERRERRNMGLPEVVYIGPVHAFISPEDIDWDGLNRGQQFRVPRGSFRRNPFNKPDAVYTVLDDDDTYSGAADSKVLVIFDMEGLQEMDAENFDPDQPHFVRNVIAERSRLEASGFIKILDVAELLHAYGIDITDDDAPDDDDTARWNYS